jgi:hypothetical protein
VLPKISRGMSGVERIQSAFALVRGTGGSLCKTVGVVLRWFESITRHAAETAPDQQRCRWGPFCRGVDGERFGETVLVRPGQRGSWR